MTQPLSKEALESLKRQAQAEDSRGLSLVVVPISDLLSIVAEVRHLRSERTGYRQGLEDAKKMAEQWRETYKPRQNNTQSAQRLALTNLIAEIAEVLERLDVDAEQAREQIDSEQSQEAPHEEEHEA